MLQMGDKNKRPLKVGDRVAIPPKYITSNLPHLQAVVVKIYNYEIDVVIDDRTSVQSMKSFDCVYQMSLLDEELLTHHHPEVRALAQSK